MYRIQTLNKISSAGLAVLDKKYFQSHLSLEPLKTNWKKLLLLNCHQIKFFLFQISLKMQFHLH